MRHHVVCAAAIGALSLLWLTAQAADYPAPSEADWTARDFRFHTGQVIRELRLHYTTVGAATGEPVLVCMGQGAPALAC
jgi:homoserine O-acetyltransferase/O-succinyltransferase